jgi:hypothetical protein
MQDAGSRMQCHPPTRGKHEDSKTRRSHKSTHPPKVRSPQITKWETWLLDHKTEFGRRNRHAFGVAVGGVAGLAKRSGLESPGASPGVGDSQIAGCSAGHARSSSSSLMKRSLCLRAFVFATWVGGWDLRHLRDLWAVLGWVGALRLRVTALWFAPLRL